MGEAILESVAPLTAVRAAAASAATAVAGGGPGPAGTAVRPRFPSLSVVIPVFNEAATIRTVVARVLASPWVTEVILVDDGSSDGSGAILDELAAPPRVRVLRHPTNRGKGAALRSGFAVAAADVVVVQDADLEYDPADYPELLRPFADANADVVFGSRFLVAGRAHVPLWRHWVGNRVLTFVSNLFTGLTLTDMETCYKAFRRELLQGLRLSSDRFTIEPELTAKVARIDGVRIFEVPVRYRGRSHAEGKKIGVRDGLTALWAIVRFRRRD